jgi:hypothetical protein
VQQQHHRLKPGLHSTRAHLCDGDQVSHQRIAHPIPNTCKKEDGAAVLWTNLRRTETHEVLNQQTRATESRKGEAKNPQSVEVIAIGMPPGMFDQKKSKENENQCQRQAW